MTEAIYLEVKEMAETAHKAKRRVSVSGMLKHLGVSRSGYHAWLKRVPSNGDKNNPVVYAFGGDTYIGILDYPSQMIFQRNEASGEIGRAHV